MEPATDDRRAKRNVAVLVAAQAVLGAQITRIDGTEPPKNLASLAGRDSSERHCLGAHSHSTKGDSANLHVVSSDGDAKQSD